MAATTRVLPASVRRPGRAETGAGLALAARMPRLMLEARRVAASIANGVHGRRRAGPGETFWQFRQFGPGEAAARIDWRRSGRDDRLYVREREWEAPHAIWLWIDRSASMGFASSLAHAPKAERAFVIGLALADTLVDGGERVGLLGLSDPRASRRIAERVVETLAADTEGLEEDVPPPRTVARRDEVLLIGDFLTPIDEIAASVTAIGARGARGHLVLIVDPVEETFPFDGQAILHDLEIGLSLRVGDAASLRNAYRERIRGHREAIGALTRERGWTMTVHHTDRPASEAAIRVMTLVASSRGGMG